MNKLYKIYKIIMPIMLIVSYKTSMAGVLTIKNVSKRPLICYLDVGINKNVSLFENLVLLPSHPSPLPQGGEGMDFASLFKGGDIDGLHHLNLALPESRWQSSPRRHGSIHKYVAVPPLAWIPAFAEMTKRCSDQRNFSRVVILPPKSETDIVGDQINKTVLSCDGIKIKNLDINTSSPDRILILNGKANHALNVLLYSRIPNSLQNNFEKMTERIINEFQSMHPKILLNIVLSRHPNFDTYDLNNLLQLLGGNGFDLVELDSMQLDFSVQHGLISPVTIRQPDKFIPASIAAAQVNRSFYGVPSRVCQYYLFTRSKPKLSTFETLLTEPRNSSTSKLKLIADFNGQWNALSFYLQVYASLYGLQNLSKALDEPIKHLVIKNMAILADQCSHQQQNKCTNSHYHRQEIGQIEKAFIDTNAQSYLGFSESAFYILLHGRKVMPILNLYAKPVTYGNYYKPLIYTDVYVKNSSTCESRVCNQDFQLFTTYMNMVNTQAWINFSKDSEQAAPPRYLLSAIKAFYELPEVKKDNLYTGFAQNLKLASAYPNNVNFEHYNQFYQQICKNLTKKVKNYICH